MTKAIKLVHHKVEDPIVTDSIIAVKTILGDGKLPGFISGGMAVQSYLPASERRKSIDLDFNTLFGGDTAEFREATLPIMTTLSSNGYEVSFQKKDLVFEYFVRNGGDSFLIQHKRRTAKNLEKHRRSLEREVANNRVITRNNLSYPVISPEDITLHKLSRISKFSDNFSGVAVPNQLPLDKLKTKADDLRIELIERLEGSSPGAVAQMRVLYDCYDIGSVAKHAGLNATYFKEALKDWTLAIGGEDRAYSILEKIGVSLK